MPSNWLRNASKIKTLTSKNSHSVTDEHSGPITSVHGMDNPNTAVICFSFAMLDIILNITAFHPLQRVCHISCHKSPPITQHAVHPSCLYIRIPAVPFLRFPPNLYCLKNLTNSFPRLRKNSSKGLSQIVVLMPRETELFKLRRLRFVPSEIFFLAVMQLALGNLP